MFQVKKRTKKLLGVFLNLANIITYSRIIFVFLIIFMIFSKNPYAKIIALLLILIVFTMDWLDGFIARKYNLNSAFGGIVDIAGDRIVENSLWISFAYLQLVPLWAPLIVMSRSFITDGVRSYALSKGKTTFGMMDSRMGKIFVSSRLSRGAYALLKAVVFGLVTIIFILKTTNVIFLKPYLYLLPMTESVTFGLIVFLVVFCVIRGALTIYDGRKMFLD